MDLNHCPSSATLADFSFGNGFSLSDIVLRAHISACSKCRQKIRNIESIGSDLLMSNLHRHNAEPLEEIDSKITEILENYDTSEKLSNGTHDFSCKSKADDFELDNSLDCLFPSYLDCSFDALPWKSAGKDIQLCKLRRARNSKLWMIKVNPAPNCQNTVIRGKNLPWY